jgi:glycosyltransferase involved in cell wall biosynthesis
MAAVRVAYTVEQCWHRVPGGTAVAALEVARELVESPDVDVRFVAGRHSEAPPAVWTPPGPVHHLGRPWSGPLLYEAWLRLGWPKVESATGPVDVAHATTIIPCATRVPLVVTIHDVAFLHDPSHFTARGVSVFRRSLEQVRRRAALVLASSEATADDLVAAGIGQDRIRVVPLGVRPVAVSPEQVAAVRERLGLPERFALFVGTVEPRKNLARLALAVGSLGEPLPLVVAGAQGWGDGMPSELSSAADVRFTGFVAPSDLPPLYAAATVFCLPSLREGYGLPVLEAMSHGVPVVTSRATSTEEVAGGAAVLVDPLDPADIARGIADALARHEELGAAGRERAAACRWSTTAALTLQAYREAAM